MREMKDSGVEWIGEIPREWSTVMLGSFFSEHKHKNAGMACNNLLSLSYGRIIQKDINTSDGLLPESFEGYNIINAGDIVLRLTDLQNDQRSLRVGFCREMGIVTSAYLTLRKRTEFINSHFFYYQIHSYDIRKGFYGMGAGVRQGLNYDGIKSIPLAVPTSIEQQKLVEILDDKCAQVDALIANVQKQIEKLKQYKQSLITEVVTKGLDPTVPMKDSGVEWIGEIPEHWSTERGKTILSRLSRPVLADDEVVTCFRDGEVTLRANRREEGFTFAEKEIGYQGINPGDLVVHGMDGFAGAIGVSDSRGKGSPVLIVCDSSQNKAYLAFYLQNLAYREIFIALATGIRVRSCDLRWNKLSVLPFLVPPKNEQNAIITFITEKLAQIDRLISIKQSKIEKLNAYKKSLIYEYVTGKKEV